MRVVCKCLNEQKSVHRFLSDFHDEPWVDDIIVIDGGSTDYTLQELKRFDKVKVFVHPWLDWYHDMEITQANIMISYVPNGSLMFTIDFDEKCNSNLKNFLSEVNKRGKLPEDADLIHIARRTFDVMRHEDSPFAILGEDGWPLISHQIGQFPDYQARLMRKTHEFHWVQSPHRSLLGWKKNLNLDISCFIEHIEKDDRRDRDWIERKWLRQSTASRKALGLLPDLWEATAKPEYADAADPSFWQKR